MKRDVAFRNAAPVAFHNVYGRIEWERVRGTNGEETGRGIVSATRAKPCGRKFRRAISNGRPAETLKDGRELVVLQVRSRNVEIGDVRNRRSRTRETRRPSKSSNEQSCYVKLRLERERP
jgi:hypothetical protein